MERGERLFWSVMGVLLLFLAALVMWQIMQTDYSLRQAEHRHKFGAVYMTLNNPFYEIVDEEIRMEVSRRGDILISRDPALSVERQEEAVKELIDSGVELIFINPVDWQRIAPALQLAKEANVPLRWCRIIIWPDSNVLSICWRMQPAAKSPCSSIRRPVLLWTEFRGSWMAWRLIRILWWWIRLSAGGSWNWPCRPCRKCLNVIRILTWLWP